MRTAVIAAGLALLVGMAAGVAPAAACAVPPGDARGPFEVVETIDGDTLRLDDGSQVRLVGIQAPKLPLGREGFVAWPLAPEARAAARAVVHGQQVVLWSGGAARDRHGRRLAHVYVTSPTGALLWLQGEMLRQGLARVYTFADNRACAAALLALEQAARDARRGMWALDTYRIIGADEIDRLTARAGSYHLVEGRVRDAKVINGRGYLNFGRDYRDDFTVSVSPRDMRMFTAAGIEWRAFAGRYVRTRGWLRLFNGPAIEASHPEQIEIVRD